MAFYVGSDGSTYYADPDHRGVSSQIPIPYAEVMDAQQAVTEQHLARESEAETFPIRISCALAASTNYRTLNFAASTLTATYDRNLQLVSIGFDTQSHKLTGLKIGAAASQRNLLIPEADSTGQVVEDIF